jgi:hypothetical protein
MSELTKDNLPFVVPQVLRDKLRERGVGPSFFGKVTFHFEHGHIVRIETIAIDTPSLGARFFKSDNR